MKRRWISLVVLGLAPLLLAPSCDDVVKDPTFRLWCGDGLCAWKTEQGSIRRAPTWHKKDFGVELVDTPTVISQEVQGSPRCLTFTAVADVAPSAQVTIGVDFNRDGTIESEQPIAATGFRSAKTEVTAPAVYDGMRIVIGKKGVGRAVLAEIRVQSDASGCTAPPTEMKDQPLGTPCSGDGECKSGVCCAVCSDCCPSSADPSKRACQGTAACEVRASGFGAGLRPSVPAQCGGGKGGKPKGSECLVDADCASGACDGERAESMKFVGSEIVTCTASFPDAGGEDCFFYFVRGGTCR